jgi:hypothetical protein
VHTSVITYAILKFNVQINYSENLHQKDIEMFAIRNKMIVTGLLALILLTNQSQAANECDYYKEGVEHYEKLRRMGGSSDDMNYWTAKGHELEDKLYHCRQDTSLNPVIQTTANNVPTETQTEAKSTRRQHIPLRSSVEDDPQLQRLIQTCNYWIKQTNENASQDNINFRDSACRSVDNHQDALENPRAPTTTVGVRKLKDCMKPNNRIDYEVNECVKGNIEPTWKK